MKPNIGIADADRKSVVKILNALLADEYVLYTKTRNFHWNVTGIHFHDLHKFFESQYEALEEIIDQIAERATTLGEKAAGTLKEFIALARLKEAPGKYPADKEMIRTLLKDHETVIQQLRKDLEACDEKHGDMGTSDFLTGLMEEHEKMAWMLRALLS